MESTTAETISANKFTELDWWMEKIVDWGSNLLLFLIILIVGLFIAKKLSKLSGVLLRKKNLDPSLERFVESLVSVSLKILVIITALSQLGLEMTSFVALLGAAGLAIGMAFSGTLGNLAGGIMILIFRPYKVGDFLEAQGEIGTVKEIGIFNTILLSLDNKTVIVPNGALANGNMINYSTESERRVDITIGIAYGNSFEVAKTALEKLINNDSNILKSPKPFIGLESFGDSSVNITIRVWCKTDNYWDVYFNLNKVIYSELEKSGIEFPFPQMDVHIKK